MHNTLLLYTQPKKLFLPSIPLQEVARTHTLSKHTSRPLPAVSVCHTLAAPQAQPTASKAGRTNSTCFTSWPTSRVSAASNMIHFSHGWNSCSYDRHRGRQAERQRQCCACCAPNHKPCEVAQFHCWSLTSNSSSIQYHSQDRTFASLCWRRCHSVCRCSRRTAAAAAATPL